MIADGKLLPSWQKLTLRYPDLFVLGFVDFGHIFSQHLEFYTFILI